VIIESSGPAAVAEALKQSSSRRVVTPRAGGVVLRPRTTLHAEDEEQ